MLRRYLIPCCLLLVQAVALGRSLPTAEMPVGPVAQIRMLQDTDEPERKPGPADLEEAIEIAVKRYGGRAAGFDTVVRDGQEVHEIRLLGEDGTVRTVRIDPKTGAIIPQERRED